MSERIAGRYGVAVGAVGEFEPGGGVYRVSGPELVVRVFPAHRPLSATEHDARVLELLADADLPAERLAPGDPVWVLEDGRAVLATQFVPGRQCRGVVEPDLLAKVADVLGQVHALPVPDDLRSGGGWHLASADLGTRADDVAALVPKITDPNLRDLVGSIDVGDRLPESLVHPDAAGSNVIADPGADPILIDWTGAGRGPRLLSFAVLLGAALDAKELAAPIMDAYARHIEFSDEELRRLPDALCGHPLLVAAWMHATWRSAAGPLIAQHQQRLRAATALVAWLS